MTLSRRLDSVAARLATAKVDVRARLAVEESAAALVVAEQRIKDQDRKDIEKKAVKHAHKNRVFLEVTSQPSKSAHSDRWVGHATFEWTGDSKHEKHSIPIQTPPHAKLKVRSRKLFVDPNDGPEYEWGSAQEEREEEKTQDEQEHDDAVAKLDPFSDKNGDGIADAARVGVPGDQVPPPPPIPRLPNLTEEERAIEGRFIEAFQNDPDGLTRAYEDHVGREVERKVAKGENDPPTFATDDVKLISPDYNPTGKTPEEVGALRARYNVLFHQTANAVAKRAFLRHLDKLSKLPEGDPKRSVLVTSGGCGAGKGFAIKGSPETKGLKETVGAIWDAAGEQNGTENPWILAECKKRGLRPYFLFVDADPMRQWTHSKVGVVARAADKPPKGEGRMVDARLFADSYALGAQNFKKFEDAHKDSGVDFIYMNTWKNAWSEKDQSHFPVIEMVDSMSAEATRLDAEDLYERAIAAIERKAPTEAIKQGGTIGKRIWGPPGSEKQRTTTASARVVAAAPTKPKKDPKLQEMKDTLKEQFEKNLENLDEFYSEKWEASKAFPRLSYDSKGNLRLPKGTKKAEPAKEEPVKKDKKSTASVVARVDALVEKVTSRIALPPSVVASLEEAAAVTAAAMVIPDVAYQDYGSMLNFLRQVKRGEVITVYFKKGSSSPPQRRVLVCTMTSSESAGAGIGGRAIVFFEDKKKVRRPLQQGGPTISDYGPSTGLMFQATMNQHVTPVLGLAEGDLEFVEEQPEPMPTMKPAMASAAKAALSAATVAKADAKKALKKAEHHAERYEKAVKRVEDAAGKVAESKQKTADMEKNLSPAGKAYLEKLRAQQAKKRDKKVQREEAKEGMSPKPKKLSPDQHLKEHGKCPPGYQQDANGKCKKA